MNIRSTILARAISVACLFAATATPAEPPHGHPPQRETHYASPHWQLDARFNHDRYYPARGYVVNSLPPGRIEIAHGGSRYYFHAGVWFRPSGPRWIVVAPPFGIVIPFLPLGYTTLWLGSVPYYYADDVYYTRVPNGYQVVEPPPANEVSVQDAPPPVAFQQPAPPPSPVSQPAPQPVPTYSRAATPPAAAAPDGLYVYPKNGQTETQTAFDRIDCVKWGIGQTGFDPSQGAGDPAARANFQRAASACLEARGYSVK